MPEIKFICPSTYQGLIPEPYPAYKEYPEWFTNTQTLSVSKCPFKKLMTNLGHPLGNSNVKGCPGIIDMLGTGYIIPAWTNFAVRKVNGQIVWDWDNSFISNYQAHGPGQVNGMTEKELPEGDHFHKFTSPWLIQTSPGVSCIYTHPVWSREKRFTSVSGVVHPDAVECQVNWFLELNFDPPNNEDLSQLPREHIIERGTPLMLVIPYVRTNFESKVEYINPDSHYQLNVRNVYAKNDWMGNSPYAAFRKKIGQLFR